MMSAKGTKTLQSDQSLPVRHQAVRLYCIQLSTDGHYVGGDSCAFGATVD